MKKRIEVRHGCLVSGCVVPSVGCLTIVIALLLVIGICVSGEEGGDGKVSNVSCREAGPHVVPPDLRRSVALSSSSKVSAPEEIRCGDELVVWLRKRHERTSVQDKQEFRRFKGRWCAFRGVVEDVRDGWGGVNVDLVVGQMNEFERVIIKYNFRGEGAAEARRWNKGDVLMLRGRIESLDAGIISDVSCSDGSALSVTQAPVHAM